MKVPRRRRYEGRWSYLHSEFWRDPRVKALTVAARDLLVCLMSGSLSNRAGLFPFHVDAIRRDYEGVEGCSLAQLEALLAELESHRFIVRDGDALWIVSQLEDDPGIPSRENPLTPSRLSEKTLKGIKYDLSRVPLSSPVVVRFRKHYAYLLGQGATQGPRQGAGRAPRQAPNPYPRSSSESVTDSQPFDQSLSGSDRTGSNNGTGNDFEEFRESEIAAGRDRGLLDARQRYTPDWRTRNGIPAGLPASEAVR
jgi:hypothetical protein